VRLVLGSAQFGMDYGVVNSSGICSETDLKKILDFSFSSGITEIDTAVSYGESEKNLGSAGVGRFKISSKIPYLENYRYGDLNRLVSRSLEKLCVSSLEILYLHDDRNAVNVELLTELDDLKKMGKICKTGVSTYAENTAVKKFNSFDVVQCQGNAFDCRYLGYISAVGLVYLRSIFLQGLLLSNIGNLPKFMSKEKHLFLAWENYCKMHGLSKLEMSLHNVANHSVGAFIVGVSSLKDLEQIVLARERVLQVSEIPLFKYNEIQDWVIDPRVWSS
jgi:aryl-alcohol dehydrogenase-like predicted oxidoreductase